MSVTWIYIISIALYSVLILLRITNKRIEQKFIQTHDGAQVFKVRQKDFFWTVATVCTVITILINGLSLVGGNGLQTQSIIVTLLILGMAVLSIHTKVMIHEKIFHIAGFELGVEHIESFTQKKGKTSVKHNIQFDKAINGYEGVVFYASKEDAENIKKCYETYTHNEVK